MKIVNIIIKNYKNKFTKIINIKFLISNVNDSVRDSLVVSSDPDNPTLAFKIK